ncbi:MAG: hypothetical protein KDB14_13540 [Planctomycetales bacterium]|nr:hypothetical protein [Planctomycetales bacterium]
MNLEQQLITRRLEPTEQTTLSREVQEIALRQSRYLDGANFRSIHPEDLRRLFELYDDRYFDGACRQAVGKAPLSFRLSPRMTSAGGKTVREETTRPGRPSIVKYEIVISTTLLFQTFHDVDRPVSVTGLMCQNRFEALQRIFEHELVHLMEMVVWVHSSCAQSRFQSIARRFFGHREHTHQLITPKERAVAKFNIRPGDAVEFTFEGRRLKGFVNRITKRATVLVESPTGRPYTDGKSYEKYYVPVASLRRRPK